jgi:nucleoside-diphosphate-sugar epimerase
MFALIDAAEQGGVARLIYLSSAGLGRRRNAQQPLDKWGIAR